MANSRMSPYTMKINVEECRERIVQFKLDCKENLRLQAEAQKEELRIEAKSVEPYSLFFSEYEARFILDRLCDASTPPENTEYFRFLLERHFDFDYITADGNAPDDWGRRGISLLPLDVLIHSLSWACDEWATEFRIDWEDTYIRGIPGHGGREVHAVPHPWPWPERNPDYEHTHISDTPIGHSSGKAIKLKRRWNLDGKYIQVAEFPDNWEPIKGWPDIEEPETHWLDTDDVSKLLGVSKQTLAKWRKWHQDAQNGSGIINTLPYCKPGTLNIYNKIGYKLKDIEDWLDDPQPKYQPHYLYVFTNPSIPDMVKVGRAKNVETRRKSMQQTGIPTPFEVAGSIPFNPHFDLEKKLHKKLDKYRVSDNREFFWCKDELTPQTILEIAKDIECEEQSSLYLSA